MGKKLGSAFGVAAKAIGAATVAAATGAAALVKQSVDSYANYEQLVGGVETLFSNLEGTVSAAPTVLENAANAYKTAGMSANEYMETVTSFSAALVSSLGNDYQKAAEISDMAITDMSDNANKMGTSMESIQNAYQGFSKQNYTMLDNLKLGYGGTKSEMERLIEDAEKMNSTFKAQRDENGKLTLALDDVYNAIHIVQQEMGIAGTTAKEANDTISGSFGQVKAAWENLVTGFADSQADLPKLIDDVVSTVEVSFTNMLPTIENAIHGVAAFVEDIAPIVADKLPGLVNEILPPLLDTANTVVNSLITALPSMLQSVVDIVPKIITDISGTVISLLPQITDLGLDLVVSLTNGITQATPQLLTTAVDAIDGFANSLTDPDTLTSILNAGLDLVVTLADGIADNLPKLVDTAMDIVTNLVEFIIDPDNLEKIIVSAVKIVVALGEGMVAAVPKAIEGIIKVTENVIEKWTNADWVGLGETADTKIAEAITAHAGTVTDAWNGMLSTLDSMLGTSLADWAKQVEDWGFDVGKKIYEALHPDTNGQLRAIEIQGNIQNAIDERLREGVQGETPSYIASTVLGNLSQEDAEIYKRYLSDSFSVVDYAKNRAQELVDITEEALQAEEDLAKRATYIPTEALRQQAGKAVETIETLPGWVDRSMQPVTEAIEETSNAGADAISTAAEEGSQLLSKTSKSASSTTKEALTFATKAIGEYRNLGIVEKLGQALTEEDEKAQKIAKTVWDASKDYVERTIKNAELGYEDQAAQWKMVRDQFVENSEQWNAANDKMLEAQRKARDESTKIEKERTKEEQKQYDERKKALETYQSKVQSIQDKIVQAQQKYAQQLQSETNKIANSLSLFSDVPELIEISGEDLKDKLADQVTALEDYDLMMDDLARRGASSGLVEYFRNAGIGAASELQALLDMTGKGLKEYDALFNEKYEISEKIATKNLEPVKAETDEAIQELMDEQTELSTEWAKKYGETVLNGMSESIVAGTETMVTDVKEALDKTWEEAFGTSDTSSVGTIAPELSANMTVNNENNFNFTINGIQYQNIKALATAISNEMQKALTRRNAGYAGT